MQPGEQTICEIKRHPIGLIGVYGMSGTLLVVLAALAFVVVPNSVSSDSRGQAVGVATLLFFLAAGITLAFVYIANKVYWGNSWIVTSDSITQMTQTSLFHKQTSQLSLGNLEDVASEKNGVLPNMFNFGVIRAETAGEKSKFMFIYCPTPDYYAQKILAAREQFEQVHHGGKQHPTYQAAPPSSGSAAQNNQPEAQTSYGQEQQPFDQPEPIQSSQQYTNSQAAPPPQVPVNNTAVSDDMNAGQQQAPAYDAGAYRPLYPDTPPTFNHSSEPENPEQ